MMCDAFLTRKSRTTTVGRNARQNHLVLAMFSAVLLHLLLYDSVSGHGRLVEPPSRASMWRYGYTTKADVNDNELWCGGFKVCILLHFFISSSSCCSELVNWFHLIYECMMHYFSGDAPGMGLSPFAKCRLTPTVKQTGQESGGQLTSQFRILIASAVKICKQCLQTALASRGDFEV